MDYKKLEALKNKEGLNNQRLSDLTGISTATIGRIFRGEGSPAFDNVAEIAKVIGCSLDELAGMPNKQKEIFDLELAAKNQDLEFKQKELESKQRELASAEREVAAKEKTISLLEEQVAAARSDRDEEKKDRRKMTIVAFALMFVFVAIVIFDILHGGVGYIRYDELSQQDQMNVLLSAIPDWFGLR